MKAYRLPRLAPLTLGFALAFGLPATLGAIPVYYTYTGMVDNADGSTRGINIGDMVQYTFLLDFDLPGQITISGLSLPTDADDDTFYAEYVGGDGISLSDGNFIRFNVGGPGDDGLFYVADIKLGRCMSDISLCFDFLSLFGDGHPQQWQVGQSLLAWNAGGNWDQDLDFFVSSSGTLTDIAETPEPGTLMCMGLGLAALGIRQRRRMGDR
jgi:hypothetical protein